MSSKSRILIVDDEEENRQLLKSVLSREGYEIREAADGLEALEALQREIPDLVLLDVMMPRLDGYGVCKKIKSQEATRLLPVLMLTGLDQIPDKVKALDLDADDFLSKPFSLTELRARVRSMLRLRHYTQELENASNILHSIARLVEKRDAYVSDHCRETAQLAGAVGKGLGLASESLANLVLAASFHDLGKIALADAILQKAGPLNEEEILKMRRHPIIGAELLEGLQSMRGVAPIVRHHHERLDGSGYPDALKGEAIPLNTRILSVVDVYQALVAIRPYKKALPQDRALEILDEEVGRGWWDADVVDCLRGILPT